MLPEVLWVRVCLLTMNTRKQSISEQVLPPRPLGQTAIIPVQERVTYSLVQ